MSRSLDKIVPNLWFDKEASEAVDFYVSLFQGSGITGKATISGTPSGDVDILTFTLWGNDFMAINGGPMFRFNPSVSFFVYCGSDNEIERLNAALSEGGTSLMPLDTYPWSRRYAWVQDKYGLTWQLDVDDIHSKQKIVPSFLFVNEKADKVRTAVEFYTSVFPNSETIMESLHDPSANLSEGAILFAQYKLNGYLVNSMSGTGKHDFDFNEAVSLIVYCETQEEIDYYWEKLTLGGQEQPCGWVKDQFGISWQVVPAEMDEMMETTDKKQLNRVIGAMMPMMKLNLEVLRKAYNNG